jgi:hypothetical protein
MHRRNLELLRAGLAHDLIIHANQVVTKLGEFGAVALVGARWQTILLGATDPTY